MRRNAAYGAVFGLVVTLSISTAAAASHQAYYDGAAPRRQGGDNGVPSAGMPVELWNHLTPEQQTIHRTITQLYTIYFERQGQIIPVNRETVALVMKELGIDSAHAEWTAYVMQLNVQRLRMPRQADSASDSPARQRRQ